MKCFVSILGQDAFVNISGVWVEQTYFPLPTV